METCDSCTNFENGCEQTHGENYVIDCLDYEPKISDSVAKTSKTSALDADPMVGKNLIKTIETIYGEKLTAVETKPGHYIQVATAEYGSDVKPEDDKVHHPNHYTTGTIETIYCIEASMAPEGFQDYCKGNVIKYISRWREKGGVEDLHKASVYLNWLIESAEKGRIS